MGKGETKKVTDAKAVTKPTVDLHATTHFHPGIFTVRACACHLTFLSLLMTLEQAGQLYVSDSDRSAHLHSTIRMSLHEMGCKVVDLPHISRKDVQLCLKNYDSSCSFCVNVCSYCAAGLP